MEKLVSSKEIEDKARQLVETIKKNKDYKEYLKLKEEIKNSEEITTKIKEVKILQKQYVKSAYLDKKIEKELNDKLNTLNSISLYKEYINKEQKIRYLLNTIKDGLNIVFEDILNQEIS